MAFKNNETSQEFPGCESLSDEDTFYLERGNGVATGSEREQRMNAAIAAAKGSLKKLAIERAKDVSPPR